MARFLGKDTFVIRRAALVFNDQAKAFIRDWENATETLVEHAQVQPFILSEKLQFEITKEREFSRTGLRFFAPPNTDIQHTDRVVYRGEEYAILGPAGIWTNFRGVVDHVAFIARLREG